MTSFRHWKWHTAGQAQSVRLLLNHEKYLELFVFAFLSFSTCFCAFSLFFTRNRNVTSEGRRKKDKENALISGARPLRNAWRILNLKNQSNSKQNTKPTNFQWVLWHKILEHLLNSYQYFKTHSRILKLFFVTFFALIQATALESEVYILKSSNTAQVL